MTPLRRHKQYKNRKPEDTIATIQGILKEKLGIGVYERAFQERNGLFYSSRIVLDNGDWLRSLNIGTNGKGMTECYSRASAYGELMERIQNGTLLRFLHFGTRQFLEKNKDKYPFFCKQIDQNDAILPYLYAPDEEVSSNEQILKESIDNYVCTADNQHVFELTKGKEHYYIPYYDVTDDKIVKLPYDVIYNNISTNGLCAGNTPKEALIEGLSEILERYVIRKIYYENLSLPKVPRSCFEGNDILTRIEELERQERYTIDIVDCSLGIGIPAIGVIVTTEDKSEYQFHMGVDPSPITALERSLTELFQGRNTIKFKQFDKAFQERLNTDFALKESELHKTNSSSIGNFPLAFFSTTPSYAFTGFNEDMGLSDDSDLSLLVNLVRRMGFKLYVRDNSYLGFPAYSIYIPGMSELHNTHSLHYFKATYETYEFIFLKSHHLRTINRKEEAELLNLLETTLDNPAMLSFVNKDDVWQTAPYYIMSILHYRQGNKLKAESYMNALDEEVTVIENIESPNFFAEHILPEQYGCFSNCFDCDGCALKDRCKYILYLKLVKQLCVHAQEAAINQHKLSEIFR